ncbi:phosphoenolpyruvate synthase [Atopobacter sp. AH10]|uniref:phosphoenolpyruvate synthase n=1 Tax=Atopobacter sp. AH10 TaxID=2315861 RepID=UPI000EF23CF9|nr:phosphoenolpyruvate synthase [Atopobacter sp. AH10]RLK62744.1 phosphoenolpyruvate synthase [Atopobacter sp. AH10]
MSQYAYIKRFDEIGKEDIPEVGGKGANLGELTAMGLPVPPGFCVTSRGYQRFVDYAKLDDVVAKILSHCDVDDAKALAILSEEIRQRFQKSPVAPDLEEEIRSAYQRFAERIHVQDPEVAVRSSATAEDLPDASFAGQQDTYLHIKGADDLIDHVRKCWASLWTARAIYYREKQHFNHFDVALSAVVQKMVKSEKSGVMFTANPINSSTDEMMINSSWGLGEAVVSGSVTPDEFIVDKASRRVIEQNIAHKKCMVVKNPEGIGTVQVPVAEQLGEEYVEKSSLTPEELEILIDNGLKVEKLYGSVQDTEWGLDEDTHEFYFLQSRPITTLKGHEESQEVAKASENLHPILKGLPASPGIGRGKVRVIQHMSEIGNVQEGEVLVAGMTNPDMVPAMKKAAALVTDEGGRTCHAAIVSRELQIPCIVGTKNATTLLQNNQMVTVDAKRGVVYDGDVLKQEEKPLETSAKASVSYQEMAPITGTKIYMNLGQPDLIHRYKDLPFDGIGLMRTEFIFTNKIGIHPLYLIKTGRQQLMIDKLSENIAEVAQEIYPRKIVVRLSDFRTNEYRGLEGGDEVEPIEANPMIGWRGVSRYVSKAYEEGFRLECQALRRVREQLGLDNVYAMLPFVRTLDELEQAKKIMAEEGLSRSKTFKIWMMAEVPAVVLQAEEFARLVDGFSIGSNDLTQLIMGADRDSEILNNMGYFDERNEAVKKALKIIIDAANKVGITCSICGQAPSQYPELAEYLVECGVTSMSVNPDTVAFTKRLVASVEQKIILQKLRNL